ncbi:restriction endonuclease subunit S [Cysteiniphilum marinum]|uniref:restriction endonuclease subunit S n=1 Tax=Cysteiniphilum marinum TaxID=2774191 RepID=UPI00193BEEBA|nr:restriction endonuclease subunit S [Cysteiniphilum marinum]
MELTDKYKKTILGYIPIDWSISSLLKVVENQKALFDDGDWVEAEHITVSGVRLIQTGNIGIGEFKEKQSRKYIYEKSFHSLKCKPLIPGDLLICRLAEPAGRACIFPALPDEKVITSVDVTICRPSPMIVNRDFLAHYFSTSSWFRNVSMNVGGTTHKRISRSALGRTPIVLPPIDEQRSIAEALNNISMLINQLEKLITKKRQIKQGVMQALLNPFKKNGSLKDGWKEQRLGDTATLKARIGWQGLTTSEYLKTGDYFLITGTEFKNGFIDWDSCHHVEHERYKQDRNIQIKPNDVLITKDGTIGKVAFVHSTPKPATLNSGVFVIRPLNESFHPEFFYYVLMSDVFTQFLIQLCAGSTINHLYQKDLVHFKFYTPKTLEEQKEIAQIFSDMDEEIHLLNKKLEKMRSLKEGMMQSLLTGQIRLVDPTPKNEQ